MAANRNDGGGNASKVRKVLSLDGGGIRGLSIIIILKNLMRSLARQRGVHVHPWQEFDMICGTSTGGIIAIMLGRLRMSLDQCEEAYLSLSSELFGPKNKARHSADPRRLLDVLSANGKFDAAPLENFAKQTLQKYKYQGDEMLQDTRQDACKVFVCATRALNSSPAVLRSYDTRRNDPYYDVCKVWEAVRATSAASTFFPPVKIGLYGEVFVDGAFRRNNPIRIAKIEAQDIWPGEPTMFLSIGTGTSPGSSLLGNLVDLAERLKDIVVDTEITDREFQEENSHLVDAGNFYRFTVNDGSMSNIGLDEFTESPRIASNTNNYLESRYVDQSVRACIKSLYEGGQRLHVASRQG